MKILNRIFIFLLALGIIYGLLELHYSISLSTINVDTLIEKSNLTIFENMFLNVCFLSLLYLLLYASINLILNRFFNQKHKFFLSIFFGILIASLHLLIMYRHGLNFEAASYLSYISLHIFASLFINLSIQYQQNKQLP